MIKSNYATEFSEFSEFLCKPTCAANVKFNVFNAEINDSAIESTVLMKEAFVRKRIQTISFSSRIQ